jgi:hypothetical protein
MQPITGTSLRLGRRYRLAALVFVAVHTVETYAAIGF